MSARLGNPAQTNAAALALGGADGASFAVGNQGWALLISASIAYTATASIGNRHVVIDITDASDNILWRMSAPINVVAGQSTIFALAQNVQRESSVELRTLQQITASGLGVLDELDPLRSDIDNNPLPMVQTLPLPGGCSIPAGASIEVFDSNNIDPADTASATIVVSF